MENNSVATCTVLMRNEYATLHIFFYHCCLF